MNPIQQAHALGQSMWLDYIRRDLMTSGELESLVQAGEIRGVTSNPTIFEKAISGSELYTASIRPLAHANRDVEQIFDALALEDIRAAAGIFLPLYEETNGEDGFVSIEVNPRLANDTTGTLREAHRLWEAVNRPNVMIKIPATKAGNSAIEQAISAGINVNVTLIFSLDRYNEVMEAYLRGLEDRLQQGASIDHVASVASFFISRIDTMVDDLLTEIIRKERQDADKASALKGNIAIASAKIAYAQFKAIFSGPRFEQLSQHGARVQRPLWASTSTKNPSYPDTYYVDHLIGPNTVNTLPPQTLDAFRDHGVAALTLEKDLSVSRAQLEALKTIQISLEAVTQELEREGVAKFAQSYTSLLKTMRARISGLQKELGPLLEGYQTTLEELTQGDIVRRFWEKDASLWTKKTKAAERVVRSLGWQTLPQNAHDLLEEMDHFAEEVRKEGLKRAVFVGKASSVADSIRKTLNTKSGIKLSVLDSTHPARILRIIEKNPLSETMWIVTDRAGLADETFNLVEYLWSEVSKELSSRAGDFFITITEPGSRLEEIARERAFRRVFLSSPEVGDLYAFEGLLAAVLINKDARELLHGAARMAKACGPATEPSQNPGLHLGAVLATAHRQGRDKITIVADPEMDPLVEWIGHSITTVNSKKVSGLIPILHEPLGSGKVYGDDRLMIYLRSDGSLDQTLQGWLRNRLPVIVLATAPDENGVGSMFFLWAFAIAIASHLIGVNPFKRMEVRRKQRSMRALLKAFKKRGALPQAIEQWRGEGVSLRVNRDIHLDLDEEPLDKVLQALIGQLENGVLNFLVYMDPAKEVVELLSEIRGILRDRLGIPSTLKWGSPDATHRFPSNKSRTVQDVDFLITTDLDQDLSIPGSEYSFGVFHQAIALHDFQELEELGRQVFHFHLDSPTRFGPFLESFRVVTLR